MKRANFFASLFLSAALLSSGALLAQHQHEQESKSGHSHAKAETHGGEVMMTKAHHFEVVWMAEGVMVYLYDAGQKPLAAKGITGEVVFKFKDGKEQKAALTSMEVGKMMEEHPTEKNAEHPAEKAEHPAEKAEHPTEKHDMEHGKMSKAEMEAMHKRMSDQDHLMAKVDLANVKEGDVKATFTFKGLPGKGESEATFVSKYKMMSMMHHESGKHEQHH
ncbi:hypothetical protein L0337_18210 [candidate division KSB1 bacterium]|nr:hypothetical protein [candidate division KSB1 bacterium]